MLMLRLVTFIKSLFWHIYAGAPKSTHAQIIQRYEICDKCEEFDKKLLQCNVCGCNINRKSQFLNKLASADQECPLGKWKKLT